MVSYLEDLVKSVPKPEELMELEIFGEDYHDLIVFNCMYNFCMYPWSI